jgi:hypothetical protein
VAVCRGEPRLVCVLAKAHVPPPHFAETFFLVPPPEASVSDADVRSAAHAAVRAAGMANGMAELEFCVSAGRITFFELNPRLIGDPGPALIERVYGIRVPELVAALATGDRTAAWRILDGMARDPLAYAALVDVRTGTELSGRIFRGLQSRQTPLPAIEAEPALANGQPIKVSSLRGPVRLSTVRIHAASAGQRAVWLRDWLSPDCIRVDRADSGGREWPGLADHWSLSQPWLTLSQGLPGLRRQATVTLYDHEGLLAGLPCWICDRPPSTYDPGLECGLRTTPTRPLMLVGSLTGYTSRLLLRPGLSAGARRSAVAGLVKRVRELAGREGVSEVWLMHADDAAVACLPGFARLRLPPVATIPLGRRGPEAWLQALPRRRRAELTKELQRWAAADCRQEQLAEIVGEAAPLLAAHNRRYGSTSTEAAMRRFLGLHADALGDAALAFTYRDEGVLTAFAFAVEWQDQLVVRVYGEVGGCRRSDALYFYLTTHLPLRLAALRAIPAVQLGPGTYAAKTLHGAVLEARWAVPLVTQFNMGPDNIAINRAHIARQLEDVPRTSRSTE